MPAVTSASASVTSKLTLSFTCRTAMCAANTTPSLGLPRCWPFEVIRRARPRFQGATVAVPTWSSATISRLQHQRSCSIPARSAPVILIQLSSLTANAQHSTS
eukprot:557378-Rhodomonas_salina.3